MNLTLIFKMYKSSNACQRVLLVTDCFIIKLRNFDTAVYQSQVHLYVALQIILKLSNT